MAKKIFRFIGTHTTVGNVEMTRYGAKFLLDEDFVKRAPRLPLVTDEEFQEHGGFTQEDLNVWADPFMSPHTVPGNKEDAAKKAAFQEKKDKLHMHFLETRGHLPATPNVMATVAEPEAIPVKEDKTPLTGQMVNDEAKGDE